MPAELPSEMKPEPIVQSVKAAIKAKGWTYAELGPLLKPPVDPSTLSRMFKGKIRPRIDYIDQIISLTGERHEVHWGVHVGAAPGWKPIGLGDLDHAHLLRQVAGEPVTQLPPVLARVLDDGIPGLARDPLEKLPGQLWELDELRMADVGSAKLRSLAWVEACHQRLMAKRLEPRRLAELILALGSSASVLQKLGESRLAAVVLADGFVALRTSRYGLVAASLLARSAPVLSDNGYPEVALASLQQARDIFATFEEHVDWIASSVALGLHFTYLAQFSMARRCLEMALRHPAINENLLSVAITNLTLVFEDTGQPDQTIEWIEKLEDSLARDRPGRAYTSLEWIRARALAEAGQLERAAEELAALRGDVARYCTAIDPLLLFFDYAGILIRLGDQRRLAAATEVAVEQLSGLRLDSRLSEMVTRVFRRLKAGVARLPEVQRTRRTLATA